MIARKVRLVMRPRRNPLGDAPVLQFSKQNAWEAWLDKNHRSSKGVWLRLAKKNSGVHSVSYNEALEAALCFGWITGQAMSESGYTWLTKFTPRGEKSIWSKINREKALELIRSGRMKPAGLRQVERAREDGRWQAAYDSPRTALVPLDLQEALNKIPEAKAFFGKLDGANRYAILFRLQTSKTPETRARKIRLFVSMLMKREKLHPEAGAGLARAVRRSKPMPG